MKSIIAITCGAALIMLTGCNSGTPGGPGVNKDNNSTTSTSNKPVIGHAEETFTLDVPNLSTKIKQGETKTVTIAIKRGKNIDQDVKLSFDRVPDGVTIEPANPMVLHSDKEASITIKASDTAAIGDFTVKVVGHPNTGVDATNEFKLTVDKK
jgi:hypothetical protein